MIAGTLLLVAAGVRADEGDLCLECHLQTSERDLRLPAEQVPASAHRHAAIGCVGCHGGDAGEPTARAHDPAAGYVGKPTAEQIEALCGGCHADANRVKQLGGELRTDQLTLYRASRHGELAAAGDEAAPTCISCHGHHDTLASTDVRSRAHPARVAEQCGSCHADPEVMAGFRTPTEQQAQWRRSAHGLAFREQKPDAPTCTGCHGAHRETPADVESAAAGCPTCHEDQLKQYQQSPHAEPFEQQGLEQCVPCHGTHDVPRAPPLPIAFGPDGSCAACHAKDESVQTSIDELVRAVGDASTRAAAARARLSWARQQQLGLPDAAAASGALEQAEGQLRLALHSLDHAALEAPLAEVVRAAERVEQIVSRAEGRRRLLHTAVPVGIGLALVVLLVLGLRRSARRARRRRA
jgi:hypothetical protein